MSEIDYKKLKCDVEDCKVAETGLCVEGHTLETCTHHEFLDLEDNSQEKHSVAEELTFEKQTATIAIYEGEAMEASDTTSVTASSLTRLVLFAGYAYTGKTTLLASLFDLFQNGPVDNYYFAGSRTLIGLEKRCHDSRTTSGRSTPDTLRTVIAEPKFLHLNVFNTELSLHRNLLFTDIAGEYFKELTDNAVECRKFTLASRADHFVLFMDADMLSNRAERHSTKLNAIGILRGLTEVNTLTPDTFIQIVFSRWDLLESKKDVDEHKAFIEAVKADIRNRFPNSNWNIRFFEVASRPVDGSSLEFGHGLSPLLKIWSEESAFIMNMTIVGNDMNKRVKGDRQFSKFRA
jgi:hypothetical protein